jgi:hypothetical protein
MINFGIIAMYFYKICSLIFIHKTQPSPRRQSAGSAATPAANDLMRRRAIGPPFCGSKRRWVSLSHSHISYFTDLRSPFSSKSWALRQRGSFGSAARHLFDRMPLRLSVSENWDEGAFGFKLLTDWASFGLQSAFALTLGKIVGWSCRLAVCRHTYVFSPFFSIKRVKSTAGPQTF